MVSIGGDADIYAASVWLVCLEAGLLARPWVGRAVATAVLMDKRLKKVEHTDTAIHETSWLNFSKSISWAWVGD